VNATLLLDGGTGSELRRRQIVFNEIVWSAAANLDCPTVLMDIHRDYIAAGADIITANTFATTRFVLEAGGLARRFEEINRAAIVAAQTAAADADKKILVAASLSCCPPFLDMSSRPDPATELRDYRELARLFASSGVDVILLEMLQHPKNAALACRAARETGLPFWAGVSCRLAVPPAGIDNRLVSFDEPAAALGAILDAILPFAPAGIAIMHSPLDAMLPALSEIRQCWTGPLGAYAEIPYAEDPSATTDARSSPDDYASVARSWLAHDLSLLGGCCGTTPAHITALRELLDEPG
jgi:S-methylmethionine-dependent homocysteine/selenocysteine methylase